jgi:2-oxoglutarate ferredoxin oxidoreductase subunit beta
VHKVLPTDQVILHDQNDFLKAVQLVNLHYPAYPVPVGVLYQTQAPIYAFTNQGMADTSALNELYRKGATWSR